MPSKALARRRPGRALSTQLERLDDTARQIIAQARSPATQRAYRADLAAWKDWALEAGAPPWPPQAPDVLRFLTAMVHDEYRLASIQRRLVALNVACSLAAQPKPSADLDIRAFMKGLRRSFAGIETLAKKALTPAMVHEAITELTLRDQAIVLVGLATAMRRGEMTALRWRDVTESNKGLTLIVRVSKTDQEGKGRVLGLPYSSNKRLCPARTLLAWRKKSKRNAGHMRVFGVSDQTIARVVKKCVEQAGFDPDDFGAHSLRAGFMTTASEEGAGLVESMSVSGHKNPTIAAGYVRGTEALENVATKKVIKAIQRRG